MRLSRLFAFTGLLFIFHFNKVNGKIHKTEQEVTSAEDENESDESSDEETERVTKVTPKDDAETAYYKFAYKRMKQEADAKLKDAKKKPVVSQHYAVPGPFEALPGRSHNGDYWPVFPFASQYSGGLDLDPSISRHIGGDINIPVPSWGILDINGHYFNRISDTTTKFGYISHPVNMLGLDKNDFARLVSDPALAYNRNFQPLIPLGKVPRSHVPISCRAPMCNPYTGTFAFGVEHDIGGHDGVNGDIDVPIPMGKGIAYRFPIGGNIHYDLDNITISYGHNLSPIDPYSTLFTGPNLYPYEHYPEQKHGPQAQLRRPKRAVDAFAEQFGRDDEAAYRQQWPMPREISLNDVIRGPSMGLEELYPSMAVAEESFDLPMYLFRRAVQKELPLREYIDVKGMPVEVDKWQLIRRANAFLRPYVVGP